MVSLAMLVKNKEASLELNGWTKKGDRYHSRGKWTIYKHGGTLGSVACIIKDFLPAKESIALNFYNKTLGKYKWGGLWLVSPDGIVQESSYRKFAKF